MAACDPRHGRYLTGGLRIYLRRSLLLRTSLGLGKPLYANCFLLPAASCPWITHPSPSLLSTLSRSHISPPHPFLFSYFSSSMFILHKPMFLITFHSQWLPCSVVECP